MQKLRVYFTGIGSGGHVGEFSKALYSPRFFGAPRQATEHPARSKFPEFRGARGGGSAHAIFPENRRNDLLHQRGANGLGLLDRLSGGVRENGETWSRKRHIGQKLRELRA